EWSCKVAPGRRVVLAAVEDDRVECPVELAVATAAEPLPARLAARGRDPRHARGAGAGREEKAVRRVRQRRRSSSGEAGCSARAASRAAAHAAARAAAPGR